MAFIVLSCSETRQNFSATAIKSVPLRVLLVKYYNNHGYFPTSLDLLKSVDPNFISGADSWNKWTYSSDKETYNIWIYPGLTRQSLWLKFNPKITAETGWFSNNDDGNFVAQPIKLLDIEDRLIRSLLENKK